VIGYGPWGGTRKWGRLETADQAVVDAVEQRIEDMRAGRILSPQIFRQAELEELMRNGQAKRIGFAIEA